MGGRAASQSDNVSSFAGTPTAREEPGATENPAAPARSGEWGEGRGEAMWWRNGGT